jgi:hypothetical protein
MHTPTSPLGIGSVVSRLSRYAALSVAFGVVFGCASSPDGSTAAAPSGPRFPLPQAWHFDPTTNPHPECDPAGHIMAAARSTEGVEDAEAQARASVARQISSSIESEVDRVVTAVVTGDESQMNRSLKKSVVESSRFSHNELIVAKPPHAFDPERGEYFALVCLNRLKAVSVVENEARDPIARLETALASAETARANGDVPMFTRAFRDARQHAPRAFSSLALLHALRGASDPRGGALTAGFAGVVAEASRIRHAARVTLSMDADGMDDAQKSALVSHLRTSLEGTGLPLSVDEKPCGKTDKGRTHVNVKGQANCKWGSLGHMCKPIFVVAATACGEAPRKLLESSLEGAGGVHAKDPNKALEKAVAGTKFDAVASELTRVIHSEVPIDE